MNSSVLLKKEHYFQDAMDIDFFIGILLISTKRNTQATEVLRKIQAHYLK